MDTAVNQPESSHDQPTFRITHFAWQHPDSTRWHHARVDPTVGCLIFDPNRSQAHVLIDTQTQQLIALSLERPVFYSGFTVLFSGATSFSGPASSSSSALAFKVCCVDEPEHERLVRHWFGAGYSVWPLGSCSGTSALVCAVVRAHSRLLPDRPSACLPLGLSAQLPAGRQQAAPRQEQRTNNARTLSAQLRDCVLDPDFVALVHACSNELKQLLAE
eukprot:m.19569 g.19569  ORF g.19569 m.19569 type:complete len:217 (-) comp31126_c0_seq4:88-738(-)